MGNNKMKNMVILKNLPSNLVEEAIIILKSNKKVKKLEKIDKKIKKEKFENIPREKDYIIKEAEMLISNYISKLENRHKQKQVKDIKKDPRYIKLRNYSYIATLIIITQALLLIIK